MSSRSSFSKQVGMRLGVASPNCRPHGPAASVQHGRACRISIVYVRNTPLEAGTKPAELQSSDYRSNLTHKEVSERVVGARANHGGTLSALERLKVVSEREFVHDC